MAAHNSVVKLLSYNCRGYNASKRSYMAVLLSKCDFIFCQEHWLSGGQLDRLHEVSESHYSAAVSGFGSAEILVALIAAGQCFGHGNLTEMFRLLTHIVIGCVHFVL